MSNNLRESVIVPLDELHSFPNHPFKVLHDDALESLAESIRQNGLLHRIVIRPRSAGGYEIIAGHRRAAASRMAGCTTIAADLRRDLSDDDAVMAMIETNLRQRPKLLPSERAAAYKMLRDTLAHQGVAQDGFSRETKEEIARMYGESPRQVTRYIRLTYLEDRLLSLTDTGKLKLGSAIAISFLTPEAQGWIAEHHERTGKFPSAAQIGRMRKLSEKGALSKDAFDALMLEASAPKSCQDEFFDTLREKHFPGFTDEDIKRQLYDLVEEHFHRRRMGC